MFLFCSHEVNERDPYSTLSSHWQVPQFRKDRRVNLQAIIHAAIEIGDQSGFITFDQLNELLSPADRLESKDIEAVLEALSARGINLTEA